MFREIVHIDEAKCNGCGDCVPSCHEGAIRIVHGKAKLIKDALCDGLGACLGHCPQDAISIERREADEFDEALVATHTAGKHQATVKYDGLPLVMVDQLTSQRPARPAATQQPKAHHGGCPGSRLQQFDKPAERAAGSDADQREATPSELTHWPVQINLLPPQAPVLRNARLLVAADCTPIAYADFHSKLLKNRKVMIGCPKFDNLAGYVERLTQIIGYNELEEIVVARMEVPCCTGITMAVCEARKRANVPLVVIEVVIGTNGELLSEREIPAEPAD